jgi:hypothetical protein
MQWPAGEVSLGPDVAVFCHFDPDGAVRPDVLGYVAALRSAGFSVVVVSNSGRLVPEDAAALRGLCAAVLVRRNSGRDFAAWREAMGRLGLPRVETRRLLLANDSVCGPLAPLEPLLARMDDAADMWGMTDSEELGWHLQSFFLLVGSGVFRSKAWQRFWRGVRPMPSKLLTILWYEVGLSRYLTRAGFRLRALFPVRQYSPSPCGRGLGGGGGARDGFDDGATAASPPPPNPLLQGEGEKFNRHHPSQNHHFQPDIQSHQPQGRPLNPTLSSWQALRAAGFPFVKRSVLRTDPNAIPDRAGMP